MDTSEVINDLLLDKAIAEHTQVCGCNKLWICSKPISAIIRRRWRIMVDYAAKKGLDKTHLFRYTTI